MVEVGWTGQLSEDQQGTDPGPVDPGTPGTRRHLNGERIASSCDAHSQGDSALRVLVGHTDFGPPPVLQDRRERKLEAGLRSDVYDVPKGKAALRSDASARGLTEEFQLRLQGVREGVPHRQRRFDVETL